MTVEIIPATIADAEALAIIQQKAFKRLYDIYQDEGSPYLRGADEIKRWFEHPNVRVYVYKIMVDGILCGGVVFYERNNMPGVYYLARIYILPEMQGKGIASTAILLCEETVANANLWILDFPLNEAANRRCYEKAGYTDTGERCDQSKGAITLAYMEKQLPSFRDAKKHINDPVIQDIMAASIFEPSHETMVAETEKFHQNESWQLFAWVDNGEILGVCGVEVHTDYIVIKSIAVTEHARRRGIGSSMIKTLREKYSMGIRAETDDDAVDFYRKCGFETTAVYKHYGDNKVRRWICFL